MRLNNPKTLNHCAILRAAVSNSGPLAQQSCFLSNQFCTCTECPSEAEMVSGHSLTGSTTGPLPFDPFLFSAGHHLTPAQQSG